MEIDLAQPKSTYSDGDIISHQGAICTKTWKILSGEVTFLSETAEGSIFRKKLSSGEVFGQLDTPNKYTAKAHGNTVLKAIDMSSGDIPAAIKGQSQDKRGFLSVLSKNDLLGPTPNALDKIGPFYSNPGLVQRLLGGLGKNEDRIGIRVAPLIGENSSKFTRQIISALGNNNCVETRSFHKNIHIDLNENILPQVNVLFKKVRNDLAHKRADILVWGYISSLKKIIYLRFIPLTMWDQQAPGAFNLETEIALPIEFQKPQVDLLRFITISAALQSMSKRSPVSIRLLKSYLETASQAIHIQTETQEISDRVANENCYASALCTLSLPNYEKDILESALSHFRRALELIEKKDRASIYGHIQKHIGSILHIEADRIGDMKVLKEAICCLEDSGQYIDSNENPQSWGTSQFRLGLISYRQGQSLGDTGHLKNSVEQFKLALDVYDRKTNSKRWAEIMSHFAQALQVLGEHTQSLEALATSANACLAILEVRSKEKTPIAWAAAQNNLGSALFLLGKRTRNVGRLKRAITAFEQCLDLYQEINAKKLAEITYSNLRRARDMLTNFEWEDSILNDIPRDPSGLPEPGEGLLKRRGYNQTATMRNAS